MSKPNSNYFRGTQGHKSFYGHELSDFITSSKNAEAIIADRVKDLDTREHKIKHKKLLNRQQMKLIKDKLEIIADEEFIIEAKTFCKDHNDELPLLPLCLVADDVNPLHKHERRIYDDFSTKKKIVQKIICNQAGIEWISFKKNWIHPCLEMFEEDIQRYELGERSFLYDDAKYLHCALEYSKIKINNPDPHAFIPLSKKTGFKSSITEYMREYIWNRDNYQNMDKPIDLVWTEMNLFNCSKKAMSFWVMRMIISAISQMPLGKYKESFGMDEYLIETFEDMYYCTLLELYTRYGTRISSFRKRKNSKKTAE